MEHAAFNVDGLDLEVVALRGEEAVSSLFRYEVLCAWDGGPGPDDLLGRPATIELTDALGSRRAVQGIVAEAESTVSGDAAPVLTAIVRPVAFRRTLGRDSRVFHDASVIDIVKSVLERGGVPARFQLGDTYAPRAFAAQYREDDWSFVERQLANEGIYYWFDHDEGSSGLVLGDRSGAAPDLHGGARILFRPDAGLSAEVEIVRELGPAGAATPDQFRLRAFDPARPALEIRGDGKGRGPLRVYDAAMGGPEDPRIVARRAALLEERAAAERVGAVGRSSSARIVPGRTMEIAGHPSSVLEGRLFITACTIEIEQRRRGTTSTTERAFDLRFRAQPSDVPFRPRIELGAGRSGRSGARGAVGLQGGVVVGASGDEVYPDAAGRVRVQHHWDREGGRDDLAGKWMRVAQRSAAGSMLLPRTGWNVMTLHEEGSVDAPQVQARVVDAEHPPPYALPRDKTRTVYKTATVPGGGSFNEILYENKVGAEEMRIVASRDLVVLAQDAKTEAVESNALRAVVRDHALEVKGNMLESLASDQSITIGGDEQETVKGARDVKVTAKEAKKVGGGRTLKVGGAAQTSVVGGRDVSVGAAQIDVSLGTVQAMTKTLKVLVGGALVKITPKGITETIGTTVTLEGLAGKLGGAAGSIAAAAAKKLGLGGVNVGGSIQAIGAAKIELAGASRTVAASKTIREVVGGAMILLTKDFADGAKASWSLSVGGPLAAEAKAVVVEASDSIAIRCGGSKIVVSTAGITITAPKIDLSQASAIKAKGAVIQQN